MPGPGVGHTVLVKVGQVLGDRYRLEEVIGRGGMSVVWRGADLVLVRQVAVKILAGASAARQAYRSSIGTDARAAASLSHPNVAAVFDYGEYTTSSGEHIPYVVMELLRGMPLARRLQDGPLEPRLAFRVCAQVAGALAAAHANGLVHRDIKPGNVMLTPSGTKVIDFGIAASVGQTGDLAAGAPVLGTPAYLAPERLGGGTVTAASDVYALGLLLFRTLTNELPWPVETVTGMVAAHVYAEPDPLPDIPGLPETVRELVTACLAKTPADRPSARSAAIVLADAAMIEPPLGEEQLSLAVRIPLLPARSAGTDGPASEAAAAGGRSLAGVALASSGPPPGTGTAAGPALDPSGPPPTHTPPARRRWIPAVIAAAFVIVAAILAGPFLIPALLHRSPPGATGEPNTVAPPGTGATAATSTSAGPGGTPASGAPNPLGGPTAPAPTTAPGASAPGDLAPTTTSPAPSTTSPPQTFDSDGGTVTAECRGTLAALTSWEPKPGYAVKNHEAGPATVARMMFKSTSTGRTINIQVTCDTGTPIANIT